MKIGLTPYVCIRSSIYGRVSKYNDFANTHQLLQINFRGGHFLRDNIAAFDAPFFSMLPLEVSAMDPQQRRLLETTYHALENGIQNTDVIGIRVFADLSSSI